LTQATTPQELIKQKDNFLRIYKAIGCLLRSEVQETYFKEAKTKSHFGQTTRVPQIYGIYQVHKREIKPRLVISSVNSIPEIFSKQIDSWPS
jgi:hypothetical protein